MKWIFCILILLSSNTCLWPQSPYDSFMEQINTFEKESDFRGAMAYLEENKNSFPGQWFSLTREEIYLNEQLDNYPANLELFARGHSKGCFYFLHPALPAYKPYLDLPGFDSLVKVDNMLREEAIAHSVTQYLVCLPPEFDSTACYPLIFFFHGGNSNFKRLKKHWKQQKLEQEFIRVYLQGYRHTDSESFTWRSGDVRSDRDLQRIFGELRQLYVIDSTRVLAGGMSAGASYAIDMSLRGVIPVTGVLAFCPGLPGQLVSSNDFSSFNAEMKVYLLGGEFDYYLEKQEKLCSVFDRMGLDYKYLLVEGMSHQYPDNEGCYIDDALGFILQK